MSFLGDLFATAPAAPPRPSASTVHFTGDTPLLSLAAKLTSGLRRINLNLPDDEALITSPSTTGILQALASECQHLVDLINRATGAVHATPDLLCRLPNEVLCLCIMCHVDAATLGRLESTSRRFYGFPPRPALVEQACIRRFADVSQYGYHPIRCAAHGYTESWATAINVAEAQQANRVKNCAAGSDHTLFLSQGRVAACGVQAQGRCGFGRTEAQSCRSLLFIPALSSTVITSVAAGAAHSLALSSHGVVFSWGHGAHGKLGHGNELDHWEPKAIKALADRETAHSITAAAHHSLVCTQMGTVYAMGSNNSGQLGIGASSGSLVPCLVKGASSGCVNLLRCSHPIGGGRHTVAIF